MKDNLFYFSEKVWQFGKIWFLKGGDGWLESAVMDTFEEVLNQGQRNVRKVTVIVFFFTNIYDRFGGQHQLFWIKTISEKESIYLFLNWPNGTLQFNLSWHLTQLKIFLKYLHLDGSENLQMLSLNALLGLELDKIIFNLEQHISNCLYLSEILQPTSIHQVDYFLVWQPTLLHSIRNAMVTGMLLIKLMYNYMYI